MTINFRGFLFVLLFFCLAGVLFGQNNDSRSKHRIAWTKDEYALQYEVLIEQEENNNYSLVLREFTEEPFIFISLPAGNYRLRVIPYDFRDVPGQGTGWKNFKILAAKSTASESQLVMDNAPPLLPGQEGGAMQIEDQTEDTDLTEPEKHRGLFMGLFAEGIGYTRYNAAFGSGIVFGGSFYGKGLGLSILYAQDAENFIFLEALAHFRFYLLRAKNNTGFFLQAEGGIVFYSYEYFDTKYNFVPVAGVSAGWRFPVGVRGYIEPVIHGGYPYIFGGGLSVGIRFD